MADQLTVEGKEYFSSKRAAEISGYAQDYIGQLARSGQINAQRIGGLWYISMDSLNGYKTKPQKEKTVDEEPQKREAADPDTIISFEGRDYVSAVRAAKISGYNQDYVGQLARAGKILSRQVGNRWYVDREGLLAHKKEKDALLAAVQAEASGLVRTRPEEATEAVAPSAQEEPFFTYTRDDRALLPTLLATAPMNQIYGEKENGGEEGSQQDDAEVHIPIRVERPAVRRPTPAPMQRQARLQGKPIRGHGKTMFYATLATTLGTIVIVLSFGFGALRDASLYAGVGSSQGSDAFEHSKAFDLLQRVGDVLERFIAPEMIYRRGE